MRHVPPPSRGFAVFLVLWSTAICALFLASTQSSAWRSAAASREEAARVRALWAARAGIEACIASIAYDTISPSTTNAFALQDDLLAVAESQLDGGRVSYAIRHSDASGEETGLLPGPMDQHARININLMERDDLLKLDDMTEDIADSILDWIDSDDDTRTLGAEIGYYGSLKPPYEPRNGAFRSVAELELVAGVQPDFVRGEDWNLNGVLDSSEDDGDASFPPDNADGKLDAGWSAILTAMSEEPTIGLSGETMIDLTTAEAGDVAARLSVTTQQAEVVTQYAAGADATMGGLLTADLNQLTGADGQVIDRNAQPLTQDELGTLFNECFIPPADDSASGEETGGSATDEESGTVSQQAAVGSYGRVNINTCSPDVLEYLPGFDATLADQFRYQMPAAGYSSIVELLDIGFMTRDRLAELVPSIGTRSNVFQVTSRGRDTASGLEVEVTATLDRSELPIVLRDIFIR